MKLLLDQNLSAAAAPLLCSRGFDAIHTREVGLAKTQDIEILAWCRDAQRIIVTLDGDFHALLALSGATSPSVVRIRIEGLHDAELTDLIEDVVAQTREDLLAGTAVSVTGKPGEPTTIAVRVRRLPLIAAEE